MLPLVKRIAAGSPDFTVRKTGASTRPPASASRPRARTASSAVLPRPSSHLPWPVMITRRTVSRPQPSALRATTARAIPMNVSGSASSRQRPRLLTPIPGSINTGTIPALKRPKTSEKKSSPGRTITAARLPRGTASSIRPAATASLSRSSWR